MIEIFGLKRKALLCAFSFCLETLLADSTNLMASGKPGEDRVSGNTALGLALVTSQSSLSSWAITETAKNFYRLKQWSRFFGIALYSRSELPFAASREVRVLEILAAIRHCRFTMALHRLEDLEKMNDPVVPKLRQLVLESQRILMKSSPAQIKREPFNPSRHTWPLHRVRSPHLSHLHPFRVIRVVRSMCVNRRGSQ